MFGLNKQKIIVYDTPGFGDSDMEKVSNLMSYLNDIEVISQKTLGF